MSLEYTNNLNTNEIPQQSAQVDNFPKTTKILDGKLKDKKDIIQNVLGNNELKIIFESILSNPEYRQKVIDELIKGENDQEKIKSIILANLPEGYVYDISTDRIVTTTEQTFTEATQTDKERETAEKDKEQEVKDKEQERLKEYTAEQKGEIAEQKGETTNNDIENLISEEARRQAIKERDKLVDKYKNKNIDLDAKTNANSETYQAVKTQLENNGTLNQLRQTHDEQFINDYILLQTTLTELKSNPTIYDQNDISYFDKIVKNLDNACNIPDTKLNDFSKNNIQATRKELFHDSIGNQGLIEQRQINVENHNSEYEKLFPQEETEKIIAKYGNFLDGDLKRFWERYQSNPHIQQRVNNMKNYPGNIISEEDKRLMNNYNILLSSCENVRNKMESDTKNMIEELCMTSQIKGFLGCIPEEYANNFQFNKANEVSINQNGILQLDGHIGGFDFSLRQDTNNVNARLQTKTMLDKNQDTLNLKGNYKNSPFILPTANQVFQQAIGVINMEELLKVENQDKYFETVESMILEQMDKLYADTKYTHNYVKEQIKNEEIINDTMGIMKNLGGMNRKTLSGDNEKLYDFFNTIHFNLQNMTSGEKELFGKSIKKLGEIIRTEGNDASRPDSLAKDENLSRILGSKEQAKNEINLISLTDEEHNSILDFFTPYLSGDLQKNLGLLYNFLNNPSGYWEKVGQEFYPDDYKKGIDSDFDRIINSAYQQP